MFKKIKLWMLEQQVKAIVAENSGKKETEVATAKKTAPKKKAPVKKTAPAKKTAPKKTTKKK
jgi:hypothetical protein